MAIPNYPFIDFQQFRWLRDQGVPVLAIVKPEPPKVVLGQTDARGRFSDNPDGGIWLAFPQEGDCVFWQPQTGQLGNFGRSRFCVGRGKPSDLWDIWRTAEYLERSD